MRLRDLFADQFGADYLGTSIGAGWLPIVARACRRVQDELTTDELERFKWAKIKEKFGGLKMYWNSGTVPFTFMFPDGIQNFEFWTSGRTLPDNFDELPETVQGGILEAIEEDAELLERISAKVRPIVDGAVEAASHGVSSRHGGPVSKIWIAGDPHGSLSHILQEFEQTPMSERPKAAILLGDIEPQQPLEIEIAPLLEAGIEVFWIRGNHDTDTEESWRNLQGIMDRNIDGQVVDIGGFRVAGLGGVFRGDIWMPRATSNATALPPKFRCYDEFRKDLHQRQGLKRRLEKMDLVRGQAVPDRIALLIDETKNGQLRKHHSSIFQNDYDRLAKLRADILVTHEPPAPHPYGSQVLADLAAAMKVSRHFHGHTHDNLPYPETPSGCRTHGVGLRGITDENGKIVRLGEEDVMSLQVFERNGGWK